MHNPIPAAFTVCLAGEAGQGIQSIEAILVSLAKKAGYHVFATKEYMSRVRGGVNSTTLRFSPVPVSSLVTRADLIVPFSKEALTHTADRIGKGTVIIADPEATGIETDAPVPIAKAAAALGGTMYESTVAAGVIAGILGIKAEMIVESAADRFAGKGEAVSEKNGQAALAGYGFGQALASRFKVPDVGEKPGELTMSGADAIALGFLAGGCDYACGYPMSPATGVLERLARYSLSHDLIVEQVEDEIGVINMALGASYAGARAAVTTSGGGFALMEEGLSLCGMIETPVVVHLAQRPGPATGLPTRTEQGDLNLVLHAGHGDFPRLILAPGTIQEGYALAARAFDLADRYQVPAIVLTDQYFVDTYYDVPDLRPPSAPVTRHIVKTGPGYRRYAPGEKGVSPRGIPGYGEGIVCVDSDEHDQGGYIVEDAATRVAMTDKRLRKGEALAREFIAPTRVGAEDAKRIVIAWGSTFPVVRDALVNLGARSTALLHFAWLYPLPDLSAVFDGAEFIAAVENNATGQFADLIEKETGIRIAKRILKYDGRPFTVEELTERLAAALD